MNQQRGGTVLGFIIGVVVGLAGALAVAVYVTKVPVPFMNKSQSRSADQDQAEAKKNKNWDPNAPLYGKNPAKAATSDAASTSSPQAKVSAVKGPTPDDKGEVKPAVSADPLGDLAKARSADTKAEPFTYYIQLGAYKSAEDAEAQRAKLSLAGIETKVTEREQAGRVVFRVRMGPFDKKDDVDRAKDQLDKSGMQTALVRVQR